MNTIAPLEKPAKAFPPILRQGIPNICARVAPAMVTSSSATASQAAFCSCGISLLLPSSYGCIHDTLAVDAAYQNARENTPHTARMAHDQALGKVMQHLLKEDTQVYKQFVENESFRRFVADLVFQITSQG